MIGRVLSGRYEIIEKIGEGGMAVVFKARCRLLKRFVAVKILKPEFTKDEKFIESFRRESQSAASLSHPNIVNVYDVGIEGRNIHFIVMEYIEGQVLSDLINKQEPMDVEKAINIAKQIASGLSHAHKNHIIHRDIKPHNIIITREGRAKVTDFGIAKAVTSATIVNTDNVMGSVHYFSPEQARGGYVDEKSDIYSLGIVLYEMVTGRVPFEGESAVSVAMKHLSEEMIVPSKLNSKVPKSLEAIILKATQKIQIKRYHTAMEMYDDLEKVSFNIHRDYRISYGETDDKKATRIVPVITDISEKKGVSMKKKKQKRKLNILTNQGFIIRMGAIVSAIVFAFLFSNALMFFKDLFFVKEILVPNFIEKDYTSEVISALDDSGLTAEIDEEFSSDIEKGQVIFQYPEEGATVKEGAVIRLIISKGERLVETPILVNKKLNDALYLLEKNNLQEGIISRETSELPVGVVIRQDPQAKERVAEDTEVNLVVSDGIKIKTILMINVVGKTVSDAKSDIESAGLKIGTIEYLPSEEFEKDQVISQSIVAGKEIQENTAISLVVSKGADNMANEENEENLEPVVRQVPLKLFYDQAENDIFAIKIYKIQDGSIEIIYNKVHSKENSGKEEIVINGSGRARIAIYFDDIMIAERNLDFETGQFYD